MGKSGSDKEICTMTNRVKAEGNIEEWLLKLEHEMQATMRDISSIACEYDSLHGDFGDLINK